MADKVYQWDFFIAHAGPDKQIAEQLYFQLSEEAKVFLDSICLLPGDDWDTRLPAAQQDSRITVVLISSRTEKAYYEREEIAAAISLARKDSTKHRVVPVFLDSLAVNDENIRYGLQLKHGISVSNLSDISSVSEQLLDLLRKLNALAPSKSIMSPVKLSELKNVKHWSPLTGTVVEATFRLNSSHTIKYVRDEAVVAAVVHLLVDGNEVFQRRIGLLDFVSIKYPFRVEGIECLFTCKTGFGLLSIQVRVGDVKIIDV